MALDKYEGYPNFYRKEHVNVKFSDRLQKVMIYVMNDGRPLGVPSKYYYNTILQGYRSAGLDVKPLRDALKRSYDE